MNFRLLRRDAAPIQMAGSVSMAPIGFVRNEVRKPRSHDWDTVASRIVLVDSLDSAMIDGLAGFSHILVVFWLDRLGDDRPLPKRLEIGHVRPGILATRSQLRPTPIGVSVVRLLDVDGSSIRVIGLDAIDATPVLDVKPYIPYYDSIPAATVPDWVYGDGA